MSRRILMCVVLVVCLAGSASVSFAQTNTATLLGIVRDASGAVITGAQVKVTHVNTQVTRTTVTNAGGAYEVPLLAVGVHTISAEQTGFKRSERTGVELLADQKVKIDFQLEVGEISDSVTVNAAAPLVATQNVDRGIVIQSNQVENLPLNARNFANLIALQPGWFSAVRLPAPSPSMAFLLRALPSTSTVPTWLTPTGQELLILEGRIGSTS